MKTKIKFKYTDLVLPLFFIGLLSIVYVQMNSNQSIHGLVERNVSLVAGITTNNELQKLRIDISVAELHIRDLIMKEEDISSRAILDELHSIKNKLKSYQSPNNDEKTLSYLATLNRLITENIDMQEEAVLNYRFLNKEKAEELASSPRSKALKDSIRIIANFIERSQKAAAVALASTIQERGKEMKSRGIYLAIAASVASILFVLYLVNKNKHQQKLIAISEASEKKVKVAAQVKENFLANMSHEIRTPLNAILGFTNILQKSELDEQQQEQLQIIQASGQNLLAIVNDILDLSKIEAGMMRIESAPFRIREVLTAVEGMFKEKAKEKNLKFLMNVEDDIPETVKGDAVRLTQVLVNLVSNAMKFTEDGGIYVRAALAEKTREFVKLELLIRDTGIGIPAEKQKFIFDRFEQAEAETTRRFGGTGLGLSIVKHLIQLQNGTIQLYSKEGEGTQFLVELPFRISTEEAHPVIASKPELKKKVIPAHLKILVAEDNIMNQQLIKHLLRGWNFEFDLVFNGVQAIEALRKQSYDIVLMDIQMPEMDGYRATEIIRNDLKLKLPVIAMTAHAMAGEKEKCIARGMTDYISKPVKEEQLYELICRHSENCPDKKDNGKQKKGAKGKVIDLKYIDKVSRGDMTFRKDMISQFVTQVPVSIASLQKAIKAKDYEAIHSFAHDMKTSVFIMGLGGIVGHLLQKLEELATNKGAIAVIERIFENVKYICMQAVQEAGLLIAC